METVQTKNSVLDKEAIARKLRRMALELAEQNIDEKELLIAGINGNGEVVAQCLIKELAGFSSIKTIPLTIRLNKKDPMSATIEPSVEIEGRCIVLVDDVANTGKTMLYALKPFLEAHPKKIQTLVLVERSHKLFPVQTDYTGLSIATTLQEHIYVEVSGNELTGAYLV
jgi:pyrimidine operon attenuation protein / uracil phosphoribosyltransferase